ncbi:peptidase M61 domain-containing protein [Cordyceps javanica]|nr:peptidase M61 domain-containing protein [Cordyceps javanica]
MAKTPPKYGVVIQPRGNDSSLDKLLVTVTLESPQRKELQSLCLFMATADDPPHRYSESNTSATDASGRLDVTFSTADDGSIDVVVSRDTVGDVVLLLEVTPAAIDELTSPMISTELHRDQGGLIGVGSWFLPHVPYRDVSTCHVEWDLSLAAPNTTASWSFGEGPQRTTQTGSDNLLLSSVFMVGPIASYQTEATPAAGNSSSTPRKGDQAPRIYSFGELPACFQLLQKAAAPIFFYARSIFENPECIMKIYIRKIPRGFSGHNFASCFMISYSDLDKPRHDAELIRYMSHEMTHNWAYLGIADFYALYLPIMAGVKGSKYFCQTLDEFLIIYYTSPYLRTPLRQVPNDSNGILVSYRRGFMYFLLLDAQLRAAAESRGESAQDQIAVHSTIMSICHKHWNEGGTNSAFWRETLYATLGKDTVDAGLRDMMDGKVLEPHPDLTFPVAGKTVRLKRCEQAMVELGFSDKSFGTRVIKGLVPGSKAQLAGMQNGDRLLYSPSLSSCRMDPDRPFWFVSQRGNTKMHGEYCPRSSTTVPSYRTEILD